MSEKAIPKEISVERIADDPKFKQPRWRVVMPNNKVIVIRAIYDPDVSDREVLEHAQALWSSGEWKTPVGELTMDDHAYKRGLQRAIEEGQANLNHLIAELDDLNERNDHE